MKKHSAVTFDAEERSKYLKGMIGAKNRRRQFYQKKVEREKKEERHQERTEVKAQRRDQLQKAKDLLQKLTEQIEKNDTGKVEAKKEVKV